MPRARERGHYEETYGDGTKRVWPTFTCNHCNAIVFKPGPGEDSGFCMKCFCPVCLPCGAKHTCVPWEERMTIIEAKAAARASLLRAVGV